MTALSDGSSPGLGLADGSSPGLGLADGSSLGLVLGLALAVGHTRSGMPMSGPFLLVCARLMPVPIAPIARMPASTAIGTHRRDGFAVSELIVSLSTNPRFRDRTHHGPQEPTTRSFRYNVPDSAGLTATCWCGSK
jgi:hypothetical protein